VNPNPKVQSWRLPAAIVASAVLVAAGVATAGTALINGGDLVPGSVTRAKLQKNAIGADQIAAGAVNSSELRNGSVRNVHLTKLAVGVGKIAPGAVGAAEIKDGSITPTDLGPGAALPKVAVRTAVTTVPPGPATTAVVSCSTGEVALSGGYAGIPVDNANVIEDRPSPASDGAKPTGWSIIVRNNTAAATQVSVYAVCAQQ
jgi:hypothetical protein